MSRAGARAKAQPQPHPVSPKRPWLAWAIYVLGGLGAAVLVLSALFTAGGYFGPSDVAVGVEVSPLAVAVWGGMVVLALATWIWRKRRVRP